MFVKKNAAKIALLVQIIAILNAATRLVLSNVEKFAYHVSNNVLEVVSIVNAPRNVMRFVIEILVKSHVKKF